MTEKVNYRLLPQGQKQSINNAISPPVVKVFFRCSAKIWFQITSRKRLRFSVQKRNLSLSASEVHSPDLSFRSSRQKQMKPTSAHNKQDSNQPNSNATKSIPKTQARSTFVVSVNDNITNNLQARRKSKKGVFGSLLRILAGFCDSGFKPGPYFFGKYVISGFAGIDEFSS
jgi:hypothetical protein